MNLLCGPVYTDLQFTISQIAAAAGVALNRLKTLRFRGHVPFWDAEADAEERSWRRYSLVDAALLSAQVALMSDGLSAEAACELVRDARAFLRTEQPGDVWAGIVRFENGERRVGGTFADVLAATAAPSADSASRAAFLVNLSHHLRRVRVALEAK